MATKTCPTCGYQMDPLDTSCPRCAKGIVPTVGTPCPSCGQDNSNKRFACVHCGTRLQTSLENIEKRPLKEYQKRATELGNNGDIRKAIAVLEEAGEFYPEDTATRNVLIELHRRLGNAHEIYRHEYHLFDLQMRASEQFCFEAANGAFMRSEFASAVELFGHGVTYHPYSIHLHEGLAAALDATGDTSRANSERAIINQLRYQAQNNAMVQQQHIDRRAHSMETAGAVGGAAVGATGAAVGTGITIVSILTGGLLILAGVFVCFLAVLLFLTCIGFPLAILAMGAGFSLIAAGAAVAGGGAVAGAGTGCMGIFAGALASGTSLLHRSTRLGRRG